MMNVFYRAGIQKKNGTIWEDWQYASKEEALKWARKLADECGGIPVIERIDRSEV